MYLRILSVYENLLMGAYTRKDKAEIAETSWRVYTSDFRVWKERKEQRGRNTFRW